MNEARLTWRGTDEDVARYVCLRRIPPGDTWEGIATVQVAAGEAGPYSCVDRSTQRGATYIYGVQAWSAYGRASSITASSPVSFDDLKNPRLDGSPGLGCTHPACQKSVTRQIDRLDAELLARLPVFHPDSLHAEEAMGPGDPLKRAVKIRSDLVHRRTTSMQRLDSLLEILGPQWIEAWART